MLVKTLVVGAACAGKTTVARVLRDNEVNAVECDDEIVRLNGGSWPTDFDTKNHVILPRVLHHATESDDIMLFNSGMPLVYARRLRRDGFRIVLLDVPDEELLRRHHQRFEQEGWTNVQWFGKNKEDIEELRSTGWIAEVVPGSRPPAQVADHLTRVHNGSD